MSALGECVVFDLDGTLIESEQVWHDVRLAYVTDHGGRWNNGAQQAMMGMQTQEWAAYIRTELGVDLSESTIARDVVNGVIASLSNHLPVLPGASEALERLSGAFRLGLATSSALPVAQSVLQETGWDKKFAAVVSADQVARGKPEPDVYLRAIEMLGADSARTAAIEDSTNGLLIGRRSRPHRYRDTEPRLSAGTRSTSASRARYSQPARAQRAARARSVTGRTLVFYN